MRTAFAILLLASLIASAEALSKSDVSATKPSSSPAAPAIVIGFVGGFLSHDSPAHGGVKLAAHLREEYPSGVYVRVFENRHGELAHREILRLLDADHDGSLSPGEKSSARIILYGHSWGGSETVNLARELQKDGIPVLLTIQVDSVRKIGEDDSVIPANVAQAANFYQSAGLVHGVTQVRAADPSRTQILGNFKLDYTQHPIECPGYPWYARLFERPHIEIECDPAVSNQVEALIRSKLSPATSLN